MPSPWQLRWQLPSYPPQPGTVGEPGDIGSWVKVWKSGSDVIQWWNSADLLITGIHQSLNHRTRGSIWAQIRAPALKVAGKQHFVTFPFVSSHTTAQNEKKWPIIVLLCSTDTSCKFPNRRKEEAVEEAREGGEEGEEQETEGEERRGGATLREAAEP